MQRYVVGFCFDEDLKHVAIVKKNRPDYQAGLFNGIGGKIEFRETGKAAMEREFFEETGVRINQDTWVHFGDKTDGKSFLASCETKKKRNGTKRCRNEENVVCSQWISVGSVVSVVVIGKR